MRLNRIVAEEFTMQSFTRNARCQRQAAGRNITPYKITAQRNHPTFIPFSVSNSVPTGTRRKIKYTAKTVTATHSNFHLRETNLDAGAPGALVSAGKTVARIFVNKIGVRRHNYNQQFYLS